MTTPITKRLRPLTERQRLAVDAYGKNGYNKKQAMLTAGFSEIYSSKQQDRFFKIPAVIAEVERKRKQICKKHKLSPEWVIERLMRLAMADEVLAKFKKTDADGNLRWDFTGATEEDLRHVHGLGTDTYMDGRGKNAKKVKKFKVKDIDTGAALVSLARHLGLFKDSIEIKGSMADRIQAARHRALEVPREDIEAKAIDVTPTETVVH